MRKHLYGFALFLFIAASGVTIYTLLDARLEVNVPVVGDDRLVVTVREPADVEKVKPAKSPLTYELKSFDIDLEKRKVTIKLKLDWASGEKPPKKLMLRFGVTTADEPYEGNELGSEIIDAPFAEGSSVTKILTSRSVHVLILKPEANNYYGYIEVENYPGEFTGVQKLVIIEKNLMYGAVPVLIRHPLKK